MSYGTGFFCEITLSDHKNKFYALITNNHVLEYKDISKGKKIKISINDGAIYKTIYLDDSRITFTIEKPLDITIIEIIKEDKISQDCFLEIDDEIFEEKDLTKFFQKNIYLIHYPKGNNVEYSTGKIKNISLDNYTLQHFCESDIGSSGSPIINLNNFKVLGIHKGSKEGDNFNLGTFLKGPIEIFLEKNEKNIYNKLSKNINKLSNQLIAQKFGNNFIPKLDLNQIEKIMSQMKKSICRIQKDYRIGTGFFCFIPFPDKKSKFPVLITNNHILDEQVTSIGETFNYSISDNKISGILKIDKKRKIFTNKNEDITIIEISQKDEINLDSFMELDYNIFIDKDSKLFIKNYIYLLGYGQNSNVGYSVGVIINYDNSRNQLEYLCSNDYGYSGGPIINLQNFKIIGVHNALKFYNAQNIKRGILINKPIMNFRRLYNCNDDL